MKPVKYQPTESQAKLRYSNDLGFFASEKEAERYRTLLDLQAKGQIKDLEKHVSFSLLEPAYNIKYEKKRLKTKVKTIKKKVCVEQGVTLEVSFIYRNKQGKLRAEVAKEKRDYKDPAYIIKRKLMRYLFQIIIIEI